MTDYTKYSFQDIVSRLTTLVKSAEGWGNAYISSVGQTLIQIVANATDELNYMLSRRAQESYLNTAKLPSTIYSLASSMAYRPRRTVSATGMVQIQLVDDKGIQVAPEGQVTIPRYSKITYKDKNFVNKEDIIVLPGQLTPTTRQSIIEGTKETQSFDPTDPDSTLFQRNYILVEDYENIEENSLVIYDNDNIYTDVTKPIGDTPAIGAISFAKPTDTVYDIRITNEGMMIIFGDDKYGVKPKSTVTLEYIQSTGEEVNIVNTGLSFSLSSATLTDDLNKTPPNQYKYQLTNTSGIINALNAESPDHVQLSAPDYVRSADRAVINKDYAFWCKRSGVGGIVDVKAYGQQESGIDPYTANNVYVVYLTKEGTELSTDDASALRAYLRVYNALTAHIVLMNAEVIPVQVTFKIRRNPLLTMANSQLYDILKNEIATFFALQEGSLGKQLYLSNMTCYFNDYKTTVGGHEVDIADFVTIDLKALKPFSAPLETQSIDIPISLGNNNDTYELDVNGFVASYNQITGDTADSIATTLMNLINSNVSSVNATVSSNVLTITSNISGQTFTISNTNSTQPINIPIDITVQLPPSILLNEDGVELFLKNNIELLDGSGNVLSTDDGTGHIYNGSIDYITGEIIIPLPANGQYYIRYKQNEDENLLANPRVAFTLSPFKNSYADTNEKLSTITIAVD